MRQWIGSHLTFANVVSLAAVFIALGGSATAVTYVVSSNSQVGPDTISGHKPPTGKHSNIIPGSVNGTDLATGGVSLGKLAGNSVNSAKVVDGSLTGADLADGSVGTAKLQLPRLHFSGPDTDIGPGMNHTVLSLDGLTLAVFCIGNGGPSTTLGLDATSSAAGAKVRGLEWAGTANSVPPTSTQIIDTNLSSSPTGVGFSIGSNSTPALHGQLTYLDANRAITMSFDGVVNNSTHTCALDGTAVPAPN